MISIFTFFCLAQVSNLFDELVDVVKEAASSFYWQGVRYKVFPNRSFIMDESLNKYGIYCQILN